MEERQLTTGLGWFTSSLGDWLAGLVVGSLPHGPGAKQLKVWAMNLRGARVGRGTKIWSGVWFDTFRDLEIGRDVSIGKDTIFVTAGGVSIGDRCMIGHGSAVISVGHRIPAGREPMRFTGPEKAPVVIEDDAWLGARVVILPGVRVGEGSVIGAGAVVTRDIPPYAVAGGVPARVIRERE